MERGDSLFQNVMMTVFVLIDILLSIVLVMVWRERSSESTALIESQGALKQIINYNIEVDDSRITDFLSDIGQNAEY